MAKRSKVVGPSEADLLVFIEVLRDWDGSEPTFQEILIDAATHAGAICERNKDDTAFVPDLAKRTNLAASLIRKWVMGKSLPNRKLAKTVVREIRIYLERQSTPAGKRPN